MQKLCFIYPQYYLNALSLFAGMVGGVMNLGVVDLVTNEECAEHYPGSIDSTMICAGTLPDHDDVDACQGDSGGPLVIKVSQSGEEFLQGMEECVYNV